MERLTGKQAQSMMEAVATIYEKTASDYRSQGGQVQHMGRDVAKPDSSGGGKPMQPASSAPKKTQTASSAPSVKTPDASATPKSDKPLATLNRAKKGDGYFGPTISAGGYRYGIPNPIRKEEVEQVSEAGGPALPGEPGRPGTPKAPGGRPHLPGEKQTPKPKGNPGLRLAGVDLFDIVKGHLIDEGLTEEEALKKMVSLTEEEIQEMGALLDRVKSAGREVAVRTGERVGERVGKEKAGPLGGMIGKQRGGKTAGTAYDQATSGNIPGAINTVRDALK